MKKFTPARITLPFREFKAALQRVSEACSTDEKRPVLQRVRVTATPARVRLDAADGFRAHHVNIWDDRGVFSDLESFHHNADGKVQNPITCLLNPEQITAVLKYKPARKSDPQVTIDPDDGHILIDGSPTAGTYDTESQYPDVDCLYPRDYALKVTVNPAELLAAVKRARVYAREGSNVVRLHICDSIVVHGKSEDLGESYTVVPLLKVKRVGRHDISIGFNADFLADFLKHATGNVIISLNKPNSPAVFTDSQEYTALVMPMHLGDLGLVTPADIPNPDNSAANPAYDAGKFEPVTVTHDSEYSTSAGYIPESVWTPSTPEPGAVLYEVKTVWAFETDPPRYGKGKGTKTAVFHLANPTPDPDAPIPVEFTAPNRHPLFATEDGSFTIGECNRCADPDPHALIDGLCNHCRQADAALERNRQFAELHA